MSERLKESLLFVAAIVAAGTIVLVSSDGGVLITRPLWYDEWHTFLVASRDSPAAVIRDLTIGGDYNPPLLHLVAWLGGVLFGSVTPELLRAIAMTCVVLALVVTYHALRRRFGALPSAAGALAVGTNSLVIAHAFEGRFYGPWLLLAALFAWTLSWRHDAATSRARDVAIAVAAVLLCTIHWYGVMTLGLMSVAAIASFAPRWREGARRVAPAAAGIVALLVCLPLYFAQRATLTVFTWVPALNADQMVSMGRAVLFTAVPVLAGAVLIARLFSPERRRTTAASVRGVARDPGLVALAALALFPLALIAFSVVVQPTMLNRYAIAAVLAWAPLVAVAVQPARRMLQVAAVLFLLGVLGATLWEAVPPRRELAQIVEANRSAFSNAARGAPGVPIVFHTLETMYPVVFHLRNETTPGVYLDLPDSTLNAMFPASRGLSWLRTFFAVERNAARTHQKIYGVPRLMRQPVLDTTPRFLLLSWRGTIPRGFRNLEHYGGFLFPNHSMRHIPPNLTLFERRR